MTILVPRCFFQNFDLTWLKKIDCIIAIHVKIGIQHLQINGVKINAICSMIIIFNF